jgi:hypothetical protein
MSILHDVIGSLVVKAVKCWKIVRRTIVYLESEAFEQENGK